MRPFSILYLTFICFILFSCGKSTSLDNSISKVSTEPYKANQATSNTLEPKLILPVGHTHIVSSATYSANGKRVVTTSYDKSAKVWDSETGMLLADLKNHSDRVMSANFSHDNKRIVTTSADNTFKVWDTQTANLIFDIKGHAGEVYSAVFSPDNSRIVTASQDGTAKIWDAKNGTLLTTLKGHHAEVFSAVFSPDGVYVLTGSQDRTAKIWDATNGTLIFDLDNHQGGIMSAVFSPDGEKLLTASRDNTVKIWESKSGLRITTLTHDTQVYSAAFSPDGNRIVTASQDNTIKIWGSETHLLLVDVAPHTEEIRTAVFSPDGKKILTASKDKFARILNAETGEIITELHAHTEGVRSAFFSPDGGHIVTASEDGTAKIWDASTGFIESELTGKTVDLRHAVFSPDGNNILLSSAYSARIFNFQTGTTLLDFKKLSTGIAGYSSYSIDGALVVTTSGEKATIWEAETGVVRMELVGHTTTIQSSSFSPDGKYLLTASDDGAVKVWNVSTGEKLKEFNINKFGSGIASFSPDGMHILTASTTGTATIWNAITGEFIKELEGENSLWTALYSHEGKSIVTTSGEKVVKLWNAKTGLMQLEISGHESEVWTAMFSPDGKRIITASADKTAKVWDSKTGKLLLNLQGHTSSVLSASYSPNGKYVVTTSADLTAKVWDAMKGTLLYTYVTLRDDNYLVIDKDNRFDGTGAARKLIYFTCGLEAVSLEQVKDQLWVPGLTERILKDESINTATLSQLNICGLTPLIESTLVNKDTYLYKITPQQGNLGETVLSVNGIEIRRYSSDQLEKDGNTYSLVLKKESLKAFFIPGRKNKITIKAYTEQNDVVSRGETFEHEDTSVMAATPNLYAVMVGISDYKGNELDLKYAAKDANDLSSVLGNSARKLLNTDGVNHVFMYNLTTATNRYLYPEKQSIKKVLEEIGAKSTPNDILVLFFAGHGIMAGEQNQFYFMTADASLNSAANPALDNVSISTNELADWMKPEKIKAQKRILIFDACNSGQAINDFIKIGQSDQKYFAARNLERGQQVKAIEKLNERSGLFILSASASNQSAYEMGRYSQGILTYALLKAIKEQPDILEDQKFLNVSRWFHAAEKTVSSIVRETGNRQQPQVVSTSNFNIGLVDEEVISKIKLPLQKALFSASNFQNKDEEISADDLNLNRLIDHQLHLTASPGGTNAIVFIGNTESADAYNLSGRYEIQGNILQVKLYIRKNGKIQHRMEIKGHKNGLLKIAEEITAKTTDWVKADATKTTGS